MYRTHTCGQLSAHDIGKETILIGWIANIRDLGGLVFIDLRDRSGITQIAINPNGDKMAAILPALKVESVIEVRGRVATRPVGTENHGMSTGSIEIQAEEIIVHNICRPLPFALDDSADKVKEDLRLSYRYLDLRRPKNIDTLRIRHVAARATREYLYGQDFFEVETPLLFKSTPEGAREFLVPSRVHTGLFYALPQSPQQYKQMLMVAGIERYFQIAKCFRDEDLRADRQPEFTQIDIEASFIDREDIYLLIEGLLRSIWKSVLNVDITTPFLRMSYTEALNRFGVDKPDMRFGYELTDLSDLFQDTGLKIFSNAIRNGGVIKGINLKSLADLTEGDLKLLESVSKESGLRGLLYAKIGPDSWKSPIANALTEAEKNAIQKRLQVESGDLLLFAADDWLKSCTALGRLRLEGAQLLIKKDRLHINSKEYRFLWVVEFPLMLYDNEAGRFVSAHHPFTAPLVEDIHLLDTNPQSVRGQHYDCVLNGVELGGGSIRVHQADLQEKIFKDVLKLEPSIVESRFGYMLEAFKYGAPPHGGIALGFDRLVTILAGRSTIRDVIAFPKNQKAQELMTQSPGPVRPEQLKELHIGVIQDKDKLS
jgi:aspartyl-tRNA synthetase